MPPVVCISPITCTRRTLLLSWTRPQSRNGCIPYFQSSVQPRRSLETLPGCVQKCGRTALTGSDPTAAQEATQPSGRSLGQEGNGMHLRRASRGRHSPSSDGSRATGGTSAKNTGSPRFLLSRRTSRSRASKAWTSSRVNGSRAIWAAPRQRGCWVR